MEKLHREMVRNLESHQSIKSKATRLTFVRNRGELAEGWYDPSTLQKAIASASEIGDPSRERDPGEKGSERPKTGLGRERRTERAGSDVTSDSDESIGPALPGQESRSRGSRMGPRIPNMDDLELKRGTIY